MPVDSSIYSQMQTPDFLGAVQKGMSMKQMANQNKMAEENHSREKQRQDIDMMARLAGSATDQASYENALGEASKYGLDVSGVPSTYDPNFVKSLYGRALSAKEQLDNQFREKQLVNDDLNRKEMRADRWAMNGQARQERQETREEKRLEKQTIAEEKKKTSVNEVEDRRRNIEDNLKLVEDQIKDKGTYEMFGSHNEDLNRRVDMIATDMAKLADPNSVARPSEVDMFKKGLVQAGATDMTNSTALNLIKNFRSEVGKRADNAYSVRGIENPGLQRSPPPLNYSSMSDEQLTEMYNKKLGAKNANSR